MVEDDRLAQSRQSELVRREKEATQAVKKLEADLFSERADHARQVNCEIYLFVLARSHAVRILSLLRGRQSFWSISLCTSFGGDVLSTRPQHQ